MSVGKTLEQMFEHLDEEVNSDTYQEVDLTPYPKLKDEDNAGFFDRKAALFTNDNGGAILTSEGANPTTAGSLPFLPNYYDFEKKEFTKAGENFYTKQMNNSSDEEKKAYLTQIENDLKRVLANDYKNRSKTNSNVVQNKLIKEADTVTDDGNGNGNGNGNGEVSNNSASNTGGQEGIQLEFGKVDNIIQKLTLRNLIYPIDADFGNTQDYMQINQFTYRAPSQSVFFGTQEEKDKEKTNPNQILRDGLPIGTPREKNLGLVKLPMPNSLADSNNVSWGADQLNALTAAVASGVFGQTNTAIQSIRNIFNADGNSNMLFGIPGTGKLTAAGKEVSTLFNNALTAAGNEGRSIMSELNDPNSNISVLGSALVGSGVLNFLQFGLSPESVLARGQGVVPNNNLALLFNSPTLREFTFTWKLTPRSREEATRVNNIIRFFKQGMAPKKGVSTQSGAASYFLGTPNVFDLSFRTTKKGVDNFFFDGDDRNHSVVRIKTCACTGCAVNYTPDGMWNAYERGQPVSLTMSLRFSELEPIFDTDYDENEFNYSPNRPDLLPVPIDAVGY